MRDRLLRVQFIKVAVDPEQKEEWRSRDRRVTTVTLPMPMATLSEKEVVIGKKVSICVCVWERVG